MKKINQEKFIQTLTVFSIYISSTLSAKWAKIIEKHPGHEQFYRSSCL